MQQATLSRRLELGGVGQPLVLVGRLLLRVYPGREPLPVADQALVANIDHGLRSQGFRHRRGEQATVRMAEGLDDRIE